MKWTPELIECVLRCHFTAAKDADSVRREQYRLSSLEYPHLATRVTVQRITDQKRTILIRYLLSEFETETTRRLVNRPTTGAVKPL